MRTTNESSQPVICFRTFDSLVDAEFAAGLLRSAGIPCEARDRLHKHPQAEPSVWIASAGDFSAATETLDEPRRPNGPAWSCATCRSENEPQFDACWSCGIARRLEEP